MKTILFVDDESDVLMGLRLALSRERGRWSMVFAQGADAALAELQRQPFDAVVSDLRMPGMDGAELLGRVRLHHPRTARLALTGNAEKVMLERARVVADAILGKPVSRDELVRCLEQRLSEHA